jgi:uncharacterized protein YjbI with pentapeptide repeats
MTSKRKGLSIQAVIILLLFLAVFFGWLGYQPGMLVNEYARGLGFTLLGVALVVFLSESLSRRRDRELLAYLEEQRQTQEEAQLAREIQLLKAQLTREVASGQAGLATRAIMELDSRGWLTDGTLANSPMAGADLRGARLGWANFTGAFMNRINLQDAELGYANFTHANLTEAALARANLDLAKLVEADLRGADLSLCSLNEADLSGAVLERATLSGAILVETNLTKTKGERLALNGANLERADLTESALAYANLERANLSGANLSWANLSKANLEKANLAESNLSGANLDDARLNGADLTGAFLFGARVSLKALATAKALANATMPDGTKYEDWVHSQAGQSSPAAKPSASRTPRRTAEPSTEYVTEPEQN